jgi:hypothetical protein
MATPGPSQVPALVAELRRELAAIGITLEVRSGPLTGPPSGGGPPAGVPTAIRGKRGGAPSRGSSPGAGATHPPDVVLVPWTPDYPDPFDAVNVLLDPTASGPAAPGDLNLFGDPRWLARMRQAAVAPLAERAAVYAKLDADLARGPAPFAVLGSRPGTPHLLARRLGCVAFEFGRLDLSSLCLR